MSNPMYPPPPPAAPPPPMYPTGGGGGAFAGQQVQGPAMGLMVAAGVGILFTLISLAMNVLGMGMGALGNMNTEANARFFRFMSGGVGIFFNIVALGVAGFIIWASMQMKQLRNWNLSVAASIVAMIPCLSPCCILGLPLGIWALVVLMKPEVKGAFTG